MTWKYIRRRTDGAVIYYYKFFRNWVFKEYTLMFQWALMEWKRLLLDLTVTGGTIVVNAVKNRGTVFQIGDTIGVDNFNVGGTDLVQLLYHKLH